ncbi:hypothetical protein BV25DRAFT_1221467 [Artomyces pyxidatus]|uniref:Uncharacterized protein n=1 Tax=Artomyces pyxidatus TaxID=48021 RepID=A0ACB8SQJ7_9AGAM|nr:hypothetical protein BV25DRAFT_1221467 [Artomyces pyxidatus]
MLVALRCLCNTWMPVTQPAPHWRTFLHTPCAIAACKLHSSRKSDHACGVGTPDPSGRPYGSCRRSNLPHARGGHHRIASIALRSPDPTFAPGPLQLSGPSILRHPRHLSRALLCRSPSTRHRV